MNTDKHIPFGNKTAEYISQSFTMHIIEDGVQTYATINADMQNLNGILVPTGAYHIYYLHPLYGSTNFHLSVFGSSWQSEDMPSYMQPNIVQEIIKEINSKAHTIRTRYN